MKLKPLQDRVVVKVLETEEKHQQALCYQTRLKTSPRKEK